MADMEGQIQTEELLSSETGIPKATVSHVLESSEDARQLLEKVSKCVAAQKMTNEKLRSNVTHLKRARVNADQQFNQLEKQLISCNNKLEHELKSNEAIKRQLEEKSEALDDKSKKLDEAETAKETAAANHTRLSQLNENLEAEKLNLIATVDRKNKEIDRLNGEWKSMFEKVTNASSLQYEAKAKLDELQSKETSYQLKERRLEQEKDLLKKQNDWLDSQLKEKSEAFFNLKKEKSSSVQQLQSQLDAKVDEVKSLETLIQSLNENNKELESKVNSFMEKLKDARELQTKTEEQYKLEISSQNKLTTLYKESSEESKQKCDELLGAVEELENFLKEAKSGRLGAESKLEESEANYAKSRKEYDEKLETLQNELRNANNLLEAARQRGVAPMSSESLAALSPTAAATSSFLKSGMTLTQIYNQYIETLDSLQVEKAENARLKEYMDDILKEIEEKAPLLQQQRKDYESALNTIDKLTEKLESAMAECERFSEAASEAVNKSEHLKRENVRMKNLTADLGNQVRVLVKECEEARGGVVSTDYSRMNVSHDEVSSSSDFVSQHLVTFRNIEELQEQNQKLLAVVRELSDEKENQEKEHADQSGHAELKSQLDAALSELDELKMARSRQAEMVEAVVRQRDMYRVLLSNAGQSPIAPQMQQPTMSTSPISSGFKETQQNEFEEANKALQEFQKQFESYKSERLANEKLLQEKNEELQSAIAEINIKNAKVSSELEHANERYKLLESSAGSFKREAEAFREKSQKLSVTLAKLETTYDLAKQELSEVKEKLLKSEVMYENLQQERSILKEAETRLMEENKSLIVQQKGQNTLLTNLQTIQNNLERQEYETRTHLTSRVEGLEREVVVLKQKLSSEADHHAKVVESWESQVKETKQKLQVEMENHQQAQKQLQILNSDIEELRTKFCEKESQLSASETRLNEILERNAGEDQDTVLSRILKEQEAKLSATIDELTDKLSETDSRNKVVESQLELAKQHLNQYKAMLAASEEALAELNKTSKLYQEKMENEQTEAQSLIVKLQADLTSIRTRNDVLAAENQKLSNKLAEDTSSLRQSVTKLTADLKVAVTRAETCIADEKRSKEICEEQKKMAVDAQDKYEKELVNHASDVKALTEAKEQLQTFNGRLEEAEEKWKAAVNELNESKVSWEEQKKIQAQEVEKLVSRCDELVKQNGLLHEQGEKLSQQVLAAHSRSTSDVRVPMVTEPSEEQESKAVKDLWEVIRYIRKEKEIAETRSELVQSESVRYRQRMEYVERQLKETEASLDKERQRSNMSAKDTKEHDEIMEKVEKLGEIEELNKVLTSEKGVLQKKMNTLELHVKKLETEIVPLKENIKSLTSQKDMLVGEKTGLKNEIQRWRSRTNQLIEQCKQLPDPEEFKKLQEDKKQLLAQQKSSKDESQKSKVQIDAMRNEITRLQAEINIKKTETAKIQEELNTLKSENTSVSTQLKEDLEKLQNEIATKNEEVNEKVKTITQLKKIARRYKSQYDELVKKQEELNKKPAEETPPVEQTDQENALKTLMEEKQTLQEEVEKLTQSSAVSKEKEEKAKKTLTSATKRIQQLMSLKEKYSSENDELKKSLDEVRQEKDAMLQAANEREMRLTVLSTQFEGKQSRMEKELKEKNEELLKANKEKSIAQEREAAKESECEKLKKKVQQFQRLVLQAQQKIKSQASLLMAAQAQTITSGTNSTTGSTSENITKELVTSQSANVPPTAAVKPTATPSTSVPVRSISTPTASIRPMAQTTAAVQPTPTATVPPTVTAQSTAVAIVSAVNEPITATSVEFRTQSTSTTVHAPVNPSMSLASPSMLAEVSSSPSVSVRPITSSNVSTIIAMATSSMEVNEERLPEIVVSSEERPASEGGVAQEQSSVSDGTLYHRDSLQVKGPGSKRLRDQESSAEEIRAGVETKKARTEVKEQSDGAVSEDDDEVVENRDEEDVLEDTEQDPGDNEEDTAGPEIVCIDDESDEETTKDDAIEGGIVEEDDDDDIVEVIDDEIDMKDEFGDEVITDEPDASTQEEISDGVPVVRVVADSTPSTSSQDRRSQEETTVTSHTVPSHSMPSASQVRLVRSQSHLAPFTLSQGQPGNSGFDDTDDCMVPSTPTLFIPKRSDGFGEMISSPRVHHPTFLFGPSAETNLSQTGGLAMGMSEEGLRVDDTRFDIMVSSGDGEDTDLGFDNVVPDLDEAGAVASPGEDENREASNPLSSLVSSTSTEQSSSQTADVSEQNVPETAEKYETTESGEIVVDDDDGEESKVQDVDEEDDVESQTDLKLELQAGEDDEVDNDGDVPLEIKPSEDQSSADPSNDVGVEEGPRSATPEPSSSTSSTRTATQTGQEARPKPNVVQLRRPASQAATQATSSRLQTPGVQVPSGRRIIRRVQGRGQVTAGARGNARRGRGGMWTSGQ